MSPFVLSHMSVRCITPVAHICRHPLAVRFISRGPHVWGRERTAGVKMSGASTGAVACGGLLLLEY